MVLSNLKSWINMVLSLIHSLIHISDKRIWSFLILILDKNCAFSLSLGYFFFPFNSQIKQRSYYISDKTLCFLIKSLIKDCAFSLKLR